MNRQTKPMEAAQVGGFEGVRRVALEIAQKHAAALREIKKALIAQDDEAALRLMRKLVGIDDSDSKT